MFIPRRLAVQWFAEAATGWPGLGAVFLYSFLVAVVLPLPSELVLFLPLNLGVGRPATLALVILVSAVGKALGSVVTMEAETAAETAAASAAADDGAAERVPGDVTERLADWFEGRTVDVARRYGYAGLTLLLAIPGAPDTVTIYAFGALERDAARFAAAAFVGTVLRLLAALALVRGAASVLPFP